MVPAGRDGKRCAARVRPSARLCAGGQRDETPRVGPALRRIGHVLLRAVGVLFGLWAGLAVSFDGPASRPLAGLLAAAVVGACLLPLLRPRRGSRGTALALLAPLGVLAWWLTLEPRNDRDWQRDVARTPVVERHGDSITVRDVRDFRYRTETDYEERWETRRYDLAMLRGVDLFLSYWGPTLIAHTILSWDFGDGHPLAVSIETRKEKPESYSAVRGFFRQYELVYVAADERDVVRLRTSFRGETVFLYLLTARPEAARALLLQYAEAMNALAVRPAWYNAATQSCTTTIFRNVKVIAPSTRFDWRLLANGRLDELAYARGTVDTSLPFRELRARSDVTARAKACTDRDDFSDCIREGLPRPAGRR
jgi:hypothetical protein